MKEELEKAAKALNLIEMVCLVILIAVFVIGLRG